jgi:transketolase C-terminal domain/subunit
MINGGLGEGVARFLCEQVTHKVIFQTFGIDDVYFHQIGNRAYLKAKAGLCKDTIATAITKKLCISIPKAQDLSCSNQLKTHQ